MTDESTSTVFLGIVHLVVESTTFYGAVAKGGAAVNLLTANEAEPAVNDYTLIYDLDEAPARQLAKQRPSLPDAVQVLSEEGERRRPREGREVRRARGDAPRAVCGNVDLITALYRYRNQA